MNKIRNIFFLLLVSVCFGHATLPSVTPVQENAAVVKKQLQLVKFYENKRYSKVIELVEELLPLVKNRATRSQLQFYEAYANYYEKNYTVSSNQFHLFLEQHPFAAQVEEAFFMRGYSLSYEKVDTRLDQTITYDAIRFLEEYLELYPEGNYLTSVHVALEALQNRLMAKSFEEAALYVRLGYYNAATVALENFEKAYPNSCFEQKTCALLLKSYTELAKTTSDKKETIARIHHLSERLSAFIHGSYGRDGKQQANRRIPKKEKKDKNKE
ncbi:outer membrane protein assembly factor BamD [Cardinium endosymbiont of Tipula unca]|uniref:outer membrane protein assembly factor BamD n=1 Tax=Cardinium endosymbiont of Tipula unca TaxID=3066216 RepID=UPI0030CE436D